MTQQEQAMMIRESLRNGTWRTEIPQWTHIKFDQQQQVYMVETALEKRSSYQETILYLLQQGIISKDFPIEQQAEIVKIALSYTNFKEIIPVLLQQGLIGKDFPMEQQAEILKKLLAINNFKETIPYLLQQGIISKDPTGDH